MILLRGICEIDEGTTNRATAASGFGIWDNMWEEMRRKEKKGEWQERSHIVAFGDSHLTILWENEIHSELLHFKVIIPKPFLLKQN